MDVNEVKDTQLTKEVPESSTSSPRVSRQREINSLASSKVALPVEPVQFEFENKPKSAAQTDVRARINTLISSINVASEATSDIKKLVKSIDGIVTQASDKKITDERRSALETEANELVNEIQRKAETSVTGLASNSEQEVRLEIEQKIGKALDVLLPEGAKDAFGIGRVSLSAKESIVNVRTSVEVAQRRIDALRKAIDEAKQEMTATVSAHEVAMQNSEASEASIRDVDAALKLAAQTKSEMGQNPESALESVGHLDKAALDLLGS